MGLATKTVWQSLGYKPMAKRPLMVGVLVVDGKHVRVRSGGLLELVPAGSTVYDDTSGHIDGISILYYMLLVATGRLGNSDCPGGLTASERSRIRVELREMHGDVVPSFPSEDATSANSEILVALSRLPD